MTDWQNRIVGHGAQAADQFIAHPNNPRVHPQKQRDAMKGSLDSLGWIAPVIVNKTTGYMIDGHERVWQALQNDNAAVPFIEVELDEHEEALALASFDFITYMAQYDRDNLDALLQQVNTDNTAMQSLLSELAEDNGLYFGDEPQVQDAPDAQIDRAEELLQKWGVVAGDIWEIPSQHGGVHRLMCGDSTSAEDVALLMDGEKASFVFSDPPYGINIVAANVSVGGGEAYDIPFGGVKNRKGLGSSNGSKPFGSAKVRGSIGASNLIDAGKYFPVAGDDSIDTAIESSALYLKMFPSAVHIWWGGNYYAHILPPSSCWIVWNKENTGNFADCELAWTNQKTAVRMFTHQWNGMLRESERGRRWHPTQKPAALAQWCFETYGKESDVILDPFSGSGPSFVAAEQTKRFVYGFEMSEEYCAVILQRMQDMGLEPRKVS